MRPPFLFGVNVSPSTAGDPVDVAQRAEALGYDFVSTNDHPAGTAPTHETWTMLTWIAARTSRVKVVPRVLSLPFRPPALVAKMAEALDRLSGGRLILGLGGGFADDELRAFGLPVPSARAKVEGLEEAVTILRGLWSERAFTFEGAHHRTASADVEPKPAHPIPIWLGTFGKRALEVTGRVADGWIPTLSVAPPEDIPPMRDRIFGAARAAGRDPASMTLVYNLDVHVGRDPALPPHVVQGSPEEVAATLRSFVDLGFSGMNFDFPRAPAEQMAALAGEVLPAVRAT